MTDYTPFYEARDIVSQILAKDLIGPVVEDECLSELPTQYYIMGKLYPQNHAGNLLDTARNPLLESQSDAYDASISLSNQNNPSSMGITVTLKNGVHSVLISGSYAFYLPLSSETEQEAASAGQKHEAVSSRKSQEKHREQWHRKAFSYSLQVEFRDLQDKSLKTEELKNGLWLEVYTHSVLKTGERVITVALVNRNTTEDNDRRITSAKCVFQPVIRLSSVENTDIFAVVRQHTQIATDPELLELEMLYADVRCYAQGHGCSVLWDTEHTEPQWIKSAFLPSYNLCQMRAADIAEEKTVSDMPMHRVLSMRFLSSGSPDEVILELEAFADAYRRWIDRLSLRGRQFDAGLRETARINIQKCRAAYDRISSSIRMLKESLKSDQKAFRAFQIANEAMLLQRMRTVLRAKRGVVDKGDPSVWEFDPDSARWYPFQIAFILHELSSFIEPEALDGTCSPQREQVDLLWFPTGGGKTEAYLGITAFVIFLRRLRNPADDGVTVIMRYTLRLLTLQQFERASILILACELLRQKYRLGGTEIAIGLWVGGKLTPNKLADARTSLRKQQEGGEAEESSPCQVQICPWCGQELYPKDYSVSGQRKRMLICCSNPDCDFHKADGLPVHIIDEAIYEHLPTFLVATIDKFAQIPLNEHPAALFGITTHKNPPELIIQDELHLISGPLGTITGIYEAAVTKLCETPDGIPAKVIASTATIRNAAGQIFALYGRPHTQFPPQGLSAKDSFFAVQSEPDEKPTRQYAGVMGVGATATTTLIRVNAALLFATRLLAAKGFPDQVIDNFWTLTGYFNSLRELGGASTQILDDVQSRFRYLAEKKFSSLYPGADTEDPHDRLIELTSRMDNREITDVIQKKLKRAYTSASHEDVYDFVLASNMISVGVDVGRLGVMVVVGQPKTNAEYIQASSRVGRDNPGLVITVYNASRSRDRSHYEQFLRYHSALYRYVEATSLTPFSDRARDRGLHALYVSLCRCLIERLRGNQAACRYQSDDPDVRRIEDIILEYINRVDPNELDAAERELRDIEAEWDAVAESSNLVYKKHPYSRKSNEQALLKSDTENSRFRMMNSMRNVDGQSGIYLLGGQ